MPKNLEGSYMSDEPEIVKELRNKDKKEFKDDKEYICYEKIEDSNSLLLKKIEGEDYLKCSLFNSLLKNISDSIYFKDKEGCFLEVSESKIHHLGAKKDTIVGKTDFDFYSPDEAQRMREDELYVMNNEVVIKKEEKVKRPNGETAWVSVVKAPRYNSDGKIIGIVGISRDVTEQKCAEEKLKVSEERYRTIFESSAVAITLTDDQERIVSWNKYTEELLNMDENDLFQKPVKSLYTADEWKKIRSENVRQKGMQHRLETTILRKEKPPLEVDISLSVLRDHNDKIIGSIGVIKDISDRKKTERQLREAHEILRMVNNKLELKVKNRTIEIETLLKQKDEFISQLGHDLKTPLTPLNSLLPLIRSTETNEKSKELLDIAIRNVEYMKNLVKKTLKLALLNSSSYVLDLKGVNAGTIIDHVITTNFADLGNKKLQINNMITKDLIIQADALRFEELINNLVSNAVKYSPDNTKIQIVAHHDNDMIVFSVKDEGFGMTVEQTDKIFDEFYKADESRHDFNSSGLGLSISKRIVEKHGGKIWVESKGEGKGSTFYFTMKKG